MHLYTIGFTQKSAERFFDLLEQHAVRRVVDIRLHPAGQLAGFARQHDLRYFLRRLIDCEYQHLPILAPEHHHLAQYRRDGNWLRYVDQFEALMDARDVPRVLEPALFSGVPTCLLCSEAQPDRCHRRLVAERLARAWPELEVVHLT
jgi:uncharacterized protein (DUF488 family)